MFISKKRFEKMEAELESLKKFTHLAFDSHDKRIDRVDEKVESGFSRFAEIVAQTTKIRKAILSFLKVDLVREMKPDPEYKEEAPMVESFSLRPIKKIKK